MSSLLCCLRLEGIFQDSLEDEQERSGLEVSSPSQQLL